MIEPPAAKDGSKMLSEGMRGVGFDLINLQ